jgi:hypothetical protein
MVIARAPEAPSVRLVRRAIVVSLIVFLTAGAWSSYRAYFQIKSVHVELANGVLRSGSTARVDVVSYGRVPVDVRLEMIQGPRSETLAVQRVSAHHDGFWDPRTIHGSFSVVLSRELLARFHAGAGVLRVTARGGPQWLREPTPLVQNLVVEIPHPADSLTFVKP